MSIISRGSDNSLEPSHVDLTSGKIETKPIPAKMRELFLGGRGLDAYLLYNHSRPGVGAFAPDNVALISAVKK